MELLIAINIAIFFTLLVFFFYLFKRKEEEYQHLLESIGSMKVILFTILKQNGGSLEIDGNVKTDDMNDYIMCSEFDKNSNKALLKLVKEKE